MKYLAFLVVLAGLYLAASSFWSDVSTTRAAELDTEALFTVERGDLTITVKETGYLKAKNSEHVKPEFKRSGTITWLIDEGTKVEEGEILVEFDKTDLERDIQDTENALIQYEAELEAATASKAIQERDAAAAVEKWELSLEIAELNLSRFVEGDAPNQVRKLRLEKEKAESALRRAQDQFEQVPELEEQGFLTRVQAEEERIHLREQEILKENAERALALYEEYEFVITKAQKEADVKDAKRELENARETATINLKEAEAKVASSDRQVNSTREKLSEYRDEHEKMTVRSPAPGIVHYGDPARPWWHDRIKVGNTFARGNTIITLPDLREMQVLVQVHEADIDLIQEEMEATITIEAVKGEIFKGTITSIASVATSSNWSDPTNKTFEVEVSMEPIERELRAGITARVEILVETLEDVVHVPIHAVITEEGEHFAFAVVDGATERRTVEIGKNNSHYVEIVSDLDVGEEVLLYDPRTAGMPGGSGGLGSGGDDDAPIPGAPQAAGVEG